MRLSEVDKAWYVHAELCANATLSIASTAETIANIF
jgi:hypothetical protein